MRSKQKQTLQKIKQDVEELFDKSETNEDGKLKLADASEFINKWTQE